MPHERGPQDCYWIVAAFSMPACAPSRMDDRGGAAEILGYGTCQATGTASDLRSLIHVSRDAVVIGRPK